jgi:hypothetical protein
MAVIEFTFKTGDSIASGIILDATISEATTYAADVTSYPVERGTDASDHIRARPVQITVEGIITNNPLQESGLRDSKDASRASNAVDTLRKLQETGTLCTLYVATKKFDNMALESFNFTRTKDTAGGVRLTLNFKQIQTVELRLVEVRRNESRSKKKKDLGNQTAEKPAEEKRTSIYRKVVTAVLGP